MQPKKKVYFFTNIIPPYRIFLFNKLEELRRGTNFDLEVFFMRKTESNRDWEIDLSTLKFKHKIGNGLYFNLRGFFFHFNPMMIRNLLRTGDEIILGGSWNNPNVLAIAYLKSIGVIKNKLSVWSEANYMTNESQTQNKTRDALKHWFFKQIDGKFIVPGEMSVQSFENWGIKTHDVIFLPNLVSKSVFSKKDTNSFSQPEKMPVFFLVARLEENIKGIKNFMEALGLDNLRKIHLKIAGTGSSYGDYAKYITDNGLQHNVKLLGNLTQPQISEEYKNADIFVLPSFSDPSPLTLVEAISTGLPVFISNRCGNHFEAVREGENGYIFDPDNHHEIQEKFAILLNSRSSWPKFSEASLELADKNFNPDVVLKRFIASYAE